MLEKALLTILTLICLGLLTFFLRKWIGAVEKKVDAVEQKQDKINGAVIEATNAHFKCQNELPGRFADKVETDKRITGIFRRVDEMKGIQAQTQSDVSYMKGLMDGSTK